MQQYNTTLSLAKLSITLLQFGGIERIYCIRRILFDQSFIYMWILVRDVLPNFKKKKKIPEFFSAMNIHDGCKMIYILLTVKHVTKPLLYPACKKKNKRQLL